MAYMISQAVELILPVLDSLVAAGGELSDLSRRQIEALVRQHGPRIALVGEWDAPSHIAAFLDDLAALDTSLPVEVSAVLSGSRDGASRRPEPLAQDLRAAILARLLLVHDFRVFDNPQRLVIELMGLVARNLDRLDAGERAGWRALVESHHSTGDANAFLRSAEWQLRDYPAVQQLLDSRKRWASREGYRTLMPDSTSVEPAFWPGIAPRAVAADNGDEVVRYANVSFPDRVLLSQRRVALLIHIAREFKGWGKTSAGESRMALKAGPLTMVVNADGFSLDGAVGGHPVENVVWARMVHISTEGDCDPVAFLLTPRAVGAKKIQVDFYQFDRIILTLSLHTTVTEDAAVLRDLTDVAVRSGAMESPAKGADAPIPDLELRVILSADRTQLFYLLHSPKTGDYNFQSVGRVDLGADPQTFLKPTFDRLNTLARLSSEVRTPEQTRAAVQELSDIGVNLYEQLFPPELKAQYRSRIRGAYAKKGLLITSDEPWIPWEMVRPYESDGNGATLVDDPPLCAMFRVSRWLAGRGTPDLLYMQQGVWVAPPDNLQAVQEESAYFEDLHRHQWRVNMTGPLSALAEVDERFRDGGTHLFHFACHGNFNTDDPNESKLKLAGDFLRPSQITGKSQAGLRRARPVIFLNACHSGQVGLGLTGLGGWAERFIDAGVSAFIGALWEVNDGLAAEFAREFYDRIWGLNGRRKELLGEAFLNARMALRAADEANSTWLAYVLYGDPYGEVILGQGR